MTAWLSAVQHHLLYRILNTPLRPWPHHHVHVTEVFPSEFYPELRRHLPPASAYTPLAGTGKVAPGDYDARAGFLFNQEHLARVSEQTATFWTALAAEVFNDAFAAILTKHYQPQIAARLADEDETPPQQPSKDMLLVRDSRSDGVKVHTSDRKNLLTLLFYLPPDQGLVECGTTLYLPKQRHFRCWGGVHHDFDHFDPIWTAPFLPNSLFLFIKTDNSFHGVKPLPIDGLRRDLLLCYIQK